MFSGGYRAVGELLQRSPAGAHYLWVVRSPCVRKLDRRAALQAVRVQAIARGGVSAGQASARRAFAWRARHVPPVGVPVKG